MKATTMIVKKINERIFSNNDIYILNNSKDYIFINENYQGLILFNHGLQVLEEIFIFQDLHMYHVYQKYNGCNLLIYSPEEDQMIFINLKTKKHEVIKIVTDEIFSSAYYWKDNILLMVGCDGGFYKLCFESYIFRKVTLQDAKKISPSFITFSITLRKYHVLKVYSDQQACLVKNSAGQVSFFSYPQQEEVLAKNFSDGWHDVESNNNTFLFIHEKKIEIIHAQGKTILQPSPNYIFLRARFLTANQIIVLSSKPGNSRECLLEVYYLSLL